MGRPESRIAPAAVLLVVAAAASPSAWPARVDGDDPRRRPPGHADAGLPAPAASWSPYDADEAHPANRVFRLAFLVEAVPDDVGEALPRERSDAEGLPEDWMLRWRDGVEADRRLFGGDGRQLPRESFDAAEAAELRAALSDLDGEVARGVRDRDALAVLLQNDLLRLAQRLQSTGDDHALVADLAAAARRIALPAEQLRALRGAPPVASEASAAAPALRAHAERARWGVEVARRSTRLFDASRTLLWSRVWFGIPAGPEATAALLERARAGEELEAPIGARALLVQGVVALSSEGQAVATDLVVDVREQRLVHRDGRAADDPTTSRDGVDFTILQLEREALRRDPNDGAFRLVEGDDQDLFRDYGTLKHTTYRAQCALCHRVTRTPEPRLGGFPILRAHAEPRVADGDERLRLAEDEAGRWLATLETSGGR